MSEKKHQLNILNLMIYCGDGASFTRGKQGSANLTKRLSPHSRACAKRMRDCRFFLTDKNRFLLKITIDSKYEKDTLHT